MSTAEGKDGDVIDLDSNDDDDDDFVTDDKPKRAPKRSLRQSTIDETLFGREPSPLAKKPNKTPSITVKKTGRFHLRCIYASQCVTSFRLISKFSIHLLKINAIER